MPTRPVRLDGAPTRLPAILEPVVAAPGRTALLIDFDGTLAPFVGDPAEAVPVPGAAGTVAALAGHLDLVAVVSGRPAVFLAPLFDPTVTLSGLYGLEQRRHGQLVEHPQAGAWREVVADVAAASADHGPRGVRVEPKGVSLTLHFRERPSLERAVQRWAASQAARSGLVARPARLSVELHPPIDADKGSVVRALAADHDVVVYAGDDLGDLPAFDALDALAADGRTVVRVAVANDEPAAALVARADVVAADPTVVAGLLRRLLLTLQRGAPPPPR